MKIQVRSLMKAASAHRADDGRRSGAVATHLRDLRAGAGNPTIESIAGRANCSTGAVWNALNGRAIPGDQVGNAIVRALGAEPDERWEEMLRADRRKRSSPKADAAAPLSPGRPWAGPTSRALLIGAIVVVLGVLATGAFLLLRPAPGPVVEPLRGPGPWPFTVADVGPLGLITRTSGEKPGIQVGSVAQTQTVWVECVRTTDFDPRPDTGAGPRWYRIRWPSNTPGKQFSTSSPGDPYQAWVYAGFVLTGGHEQQIPACER